MQRVQKKRVWRARFLRASNVCGYEHSRRRHLLGSRGFALGTNEKSPALSSPTKSASALRYSRWMAPAPFGGCACSEGGEGLLHPSKRAFIGTQRPSHVPFRPTRSASWPGGSCPQPRHVNLWRGFTFESDRSIHRLAGLILIAPAALPTIPSLQPGNVAGIVDLVARSAQCDVAGVKHSGVEPRGLDLAFPFHLDR